MTYDTIRWYWLSARMQDESAGFSVLMSRQRVQAYYQAAGGVVVHKGKVLLLDRPSRDEVRLPKGHIEDGEEPTEAALREVREEAGYANAAIVADLGTRRVQFLDPYRNSDVVRDETYYLMCLQDEERVDRKVNELQFVPIWVRIDTAAERLTFESERESVRRGQLWIIENGMPT
jgi:8-oxo-dGTP pyrophosphatase MutT (NUDIX family)